MKFQKGEFRDIKCNDINIETDSKIKDVSVSYPSGDIVCTRDNIKSLSTTTTINKIEGENSGKCSYIRGLRVNRCYTSKKCEQDKISEESKSQILDGDSDSAFSPPLARQLFTRHELFDHSECTVNDGDVKLMHNEWFAEDVDTVKSPILNVIKEDSNSSVKSNNSSSNFTASLFRQFSQTYQNYRFESVKLQ